MRTIFIGDVHGCYDELILLLEKLKFNQVNDQLIFLGDIINKGPKSKEVLEFVYNGKHTCLLGNHEIGFLKGKMPKLKSLLEGLFSKSEFSAIYKWMENLPYYLETPEFIAVHGGLIPGKHPRDCKAFDIASIRTWDGKGENLQKHMNPPWYNFYDEDKLVVFGHWASKGFVRSSNYIGLDTGCVYGRQLSAYILEEDKIVQIDSLKGYSIAP